MLKRGLVNAHTHLELGALADLCPAGTPFGTWVTALIRRRMTLEQRDFVAAIDAALATLHATNTLAVGDISSTGLSIGPLLTSGLAGVVYLEVLGFDPAVALERFAAAQRSIDGWRQGEGRMRVGLSVHAPYSCAPALFEAAAAWCRAEAVPLAIHLAESPAEVEFLQLGTGPLLELNQRITPDIAWTPPACSPVQYMAQLGVLEARPTLIHGVQVDADDLNTLQAAGCVIVHCPRSNANLLTGRMPLEAYLARGIPVALGTDSLASAQSLDMADELAFAATLHGERVAPAALEALAHETRWMPAGLV